MAVAHGIVVAIVPTAREDYLRLECSGTFSQESALDAYERAFTLAARIRFALLGHEPMIHPERFGEIVATTRGADGRVFTNEASALEWLLVRNREP